VLQDVPDELKARFDMKARRPCAAIFPPRSEQSGSHPTFRRGEDDKALGAAYNLLRRHGQCGVAFISQAAVPY